MNPLIEDSIQVVRNDIKNGLCDSSTLAHFENIARAAETHDGLLALLKSFHMFNGNVHGDCDVCKAIRNASINYLTTPSPKQGDQG